MKRKTNRLQLVYYRYLDWFGVRVPKKRKGGGIFAKSRRFS